MRADLRALEIFLAVADQGGIGTAARALHLAQPTVSAALQALEQRLGLRLVDRSPRGSKLTATGVTVAGWARDVLAASDRLEAGVSALRGDSATHLRVSASMTVAEYLVPGWLSELREHTPQVTVSLRVRNSEDAAEDVVSGNADVGFVEGVRSRADLRQRVFGVDELAVIVAPSHPWGCLERPVDAAALATAPLLLRERGSGTREAFESALEEHRLAATPVLELGSTAAIKAAVAAGTGVGVLSALAIADEVVTGRLRRVTVDGLQLRRRLRMVWRGDTRLGGAAAVLARLACGLKPSSPVKVGVTQLSTSDAAATGD
jgi:DNA-binding transcriptional LysR family regulator